MTDRVDVSSTVPYSTDGRQSAAALEIARGTMRLLADLGFASLPEVTLPNGRRADLVGLGQDGAIWIVEIKSSPADFLADTKWPDYIAYCDNFCFAVAPDFPVALLPEETGRIVADRFGGELIKQSPLTRVPPARRKKVHLICARIAAARLHSLFDPDGKLEALARF